MFLTESCSKRRMALFVFISALLAITGVGSPARAQKTTQVKQVPARTPATTPTVTVPAAQLPTTRVVSPAGPVRSATGRAYGAAPMLHLPGLGNTTYMPSGVTRRRLTKAVAPTRSRNRQTTTKVQIGSVAPVNVNEKVVNLTVGETVPDVRTPFWTPDEKNLFYSSNEDPTTIGTATANQIAANGRHHIYMISSSIPATLSTVSTPVAINNPTDPDDYLYPAVNTNGNILTFIRSSDGKAVTDTTKTWVLCYAPLPPAGTYVDPAATVVAGGSTVTFPNAAGSTVPFANVQRPTWLGNNNIVFSGLLQGDSTYHIFQVNLQPTAGQSIIFQLTAGPADERNPAVSPDGKLIAFDSTALPSFGPIGTGAEAYGAAGVPRQVAFPANVPTSSLAVNLPGASGSINRNIFTMNLVSVNDPVNAGQAIPAYTVRQFTERFTGALDFDNEEPAWSFLTNNNYSNPGGTANQVEYIAFSSTRNVTFASGDTTNTVVSAYTQGTLHHIYYVESSVDGGSTTIPEGGIGATAANQLPHQAIYLDTGDSTSTPQFDDRYPTWSPFNSAFRIGFQSDRNGDYYTDNFDGYVATGQTTNSFKLTNGRNSLFVATVIDVTAPTLLRFDLNNTTGEVVHINVVKNPNEPFDPTTSARNSDDGIVPGATIHVAVRAEDRESGLRPDKAVYVQIKNPNSKYQSMAQGSTTPAEHKEYETGSYTLFVGPPPGEIPYQGGKAVTVGTSTTTILRESLDYGIEYEAEALGVSNNITTVGGVTVNSGTLGTTYFGHLDGLGTVGGSSTDNIALYEAGLDDQAAFSGTVLPPLDGTNGQAPVWLELKPLFHFDPTTGNAVLNASGQPTPWLPADLGSNQPPGGVLYGASLVLPQEPSDWYLDVVLYDNAVNPFDPTQTSNVIIYDNVWGFSSAPPIAPQTADILVVSDYTLGQKFFNSRFTPTIPLLGFNPASPTSDNLLPIDFGAESYYTDVNVAKFPDFQSTTMAGPPLSVGGSASTYGKQGPFNVSPVGAFEATGGVTLGTPNTLGVKSYADELMQNFGVQVDGYLLPNAGRYDIWRILSRGPVPTNIFNTYLPVIGTEPPDTFTNPTTEAPFQTGAQSVSNAQRMIVWASPFSGDVFAGQGTILDIQTQNNLQNFVGAGGRLFISGQDIAYALTSNGATTNTFLTNVLQATFNQDISGIGSITPAANVGPGYTLRIQNDAWSRAHHAYGQFTPPTPFTYDPPGSGPDVLTGNVNTTGGDAAFTVGFSSGSDDVVTATPTTPISATVLTPSAYAVFNHDAAQGMIESNYLLGTAVYSSVAFETISEGWYQVSGALWNLGRRAEIMHNIVCSLRSGTITGQIVDTNGQAVAGALVRALATNAAEASLASGTAISDSGGNYRIVGLQPDAYIVYAYKNGYYSQHAITGAFMHGTGIFVQNVAVKPANPGALSGIKIAAAPAGNSGGVFASDGKTPIQGVAIQVRQLDFANGAYDIVAASTTSAADGSYSLPSIPIGNYVVIANPTDQNKNYNPNLSTVQLTAAPNAGFALTSGETVNADNTITISENKSFFANFFLTASPQAVSGTVLNSATGNPPIAGATVTAVVTGTSIVVASATTSSTGSYSLSYTAGVTPTTLLPAASYTITATKTGFSSSSTTVTVGGTSTTVVTAPTLYLTALPPGTVYGLVQVSVSGQTTTAPAAGATVSLYPINSAGQPDTTQTPLTTTVSSTVSQAVVAGIDNTSTATTPVVNSGVSISYNFSIPNVPGGASPGVTYIAILSAPAGSGLSADPAQLKVVVESADATYNANFTLEPPHTYAAGLQLVSLPGDYSAVASTAGIFGLSAATDPTDFNAFNVAEWTGSSYSISPTIKPQASKGYFVRFNNAAGIVEAGSPIASSTYTISLTSGWNLIGNPFTDQTNPTSAAAGIDLSNSTLATYSYTTTGGVTQSHVPLSQAISDNAVGSNAFYYTGSGNGSQYIEATVLTGYLGYWFEAFVPVQITLTYPGSSTTRSAKIGSIAPVAVNGVYQTITRAQAFAAPAERSITSKGLTDWRQQISVRQGEYMDTDNSIGVSGDTRGIWDNRYDTEKPPVDASVPGLTLSVLGSGPTGKAANLADSVLGTGSSVKKWTVSVNSTVGSAQPVTIYWPNIDRLPHGIQPVLVDMATGKRISMRSGASSYQFKSSGKSANLFQIEVAPPVSLPLDIVNLRSTKVKSAASSAFHFSFVVTRDSDITSEIQTLSGKSIRSMTTRAASAVESNVVWDGRSELGAAVGPGPLVLIIRAVDDSGNQYERKVIFMKL